MDEVLNYDLAANGLLSSVPFIIYWGVITGSGYIVDFVLKYILLMSLIT